MKKPSLSIFPLFAAGVCLVVLVLTGPTEALIDHPKFKSGSADIIPGRYIISFNEKSASSGKAFVQSFQKNFKKADMKVHQDYQHEFFNGMSVRIDSDEFEVQKAAIESILDRSDVGAVYPVRKLHRPTVKLHSKKKHEEVSILPHAMTQVDLVHSKLKNKGKGIFVGVLDTGKCVCFCFFTLAN
jgi:hypothetical protein